MFDMLVLLLPIFTMIGIGAVFVQRGWFPADGLQTLNIFVMNACIPVLLFSAVTRGASLASFAWGNAILYAAASLTSAALLAVVLRKALKEPLPQSLILSLGGGVANSIFLGYPIASAVIPERAAEIFSWVVLAEIAFIIPVATSAAIWAEQRGQHVALGAILAPLAKSPVTIGLVAGFGFLATGFTMPNWIDQVIRSIVQAAPFLALFLIGGALVQGKITRSGPRVITISVAKLLIHPLIVGIAFIVVFGTEARVTRDAILFASMPIFATYVVFGTRHRVGDVAASSVVLSTLLGAATVTALLAFLL